VLTITKRFTGEKRVLEAIKAHSSATSAAESSTSTATSPQANNSASSNAQLPLANMIHPSAPRSVPDKTVKDILDKAPPTGEVITLKKKL